MNLSKQLAKHLRDVNFGGNWTWVNLKDSLNGVTWEQATTRLYDFNTIAILVFHINYYFGVAMEVLEGKPLVGSDKLSFSHPPIESESDWHQLLDKHWIDVEKFACHVEELPERIFWDTFGEEKYGNYYRNIMGIIEHTHYHMGQIVMIKKLLNLQSAG